MEGFGSLSDAWERHAARWERWTRVVGHDVYYEQLNWPAFHALVPPAGRRTLDVGCGEGRLGRALAAEGHRLAGIDSSPTLAGLAREAGGYDEGETPLLSPRAVRPRAVSARRPYNAPSSSKSIWPVGGRPSRRAPLWATVVGDVLRVDVAVADPALDRRDLEAAAGGDAAHRCMEDPPTLGDENDVAGMDGTGAHRGSTSWRMRRTARSVGRGSRQRGT